MSSGQKKHQFVTNFKKDTSLIKRIGANILFFVGSTKITLRNNLLTPKEYKKVKKIIVPGDIVLVGDHRHMSAMIIGGAVTHALLFINGHTLIHAIAHGVQETTLRKLFQEYDTLIVLRPLIDDQKEKIVSKAIAWAKEQMNMPYDYEFDTDTEKLFCTQLVNEAYHHAGFDLGLTNHEITNNIVTEQIRRWKNAIRPKDMIKGKVKILFLSSFLKKDENSVVLREALWIKNTMRSITKKTQK